MTSISVYQADTAGCYLYELTAHALALQPDAYNIPAGAYTDAPPPAPVGMIQRRTAGGWETVEDHRKAALWLDHGTPYTLGEDHEGQTYDGLGPLPVWLHTTEPPAPPLPAVEAQASAPAAINAGCEQAIAAISADYPASEVLSWPKQEAEARACVADTGAPTPLLDALAAARSVGKAELAGRVIAKADAYAAYSGALIGRRQALEDALDALPADAAAEQIAAIVW